MKNPNIRVIPAQQAWGLPNFMPFGQEPSIVHIREDDSRTHQAGYAGRHGACSILVDIGTHR